MKLILFITDNNSNEKQTKPEKGWNDDFKNQRERHVILLILLIIIGFFLRFYHLDYNSLWFDEAFTLFTANHSLSGIWDIVSNNSKELANVVFAGNSTRHCFII